MAAAGVCAARSSPGGFGIDARTLEKLAAVPGGRATPFTSMNIRSGTAKGDRIDSLVNQALAGSGAPVVTYDACLKAQRAHAAEQTDNAAVIILGIALAYALIAVANTLITAMAGRRREFALLGLAGAVRRQIGMVAAAESAIAVVVGTVLAAVATGLAAVTQHVSLSRLVTGAPTVIPWTQIAGTIALCALVTVVTASQATGRATRQRAIEAAGIRE
ncbi:FtsX-like permease family protein [Kitasatospora sp. NPDC059648]|uniref:FtsX-like permease family protein n=1 Tax=Kitasatospora sp. NPDC059648 TaxID=3346894 RepID=UPI00368D26BC